MKNKDFVGSNEFVIDFSKASREACMKILDVLNAELDEARVEQRFPTLEGAFQRLEIQPTRMM